MKKAVWFLAAFLLAAALIVGNLASEKEPPIIKGAVFPHHALAAEILNSGFAKIKDSTNPAVVVIYGTNHYFPVSETFTTTEEIKEKFNLKNVSADDGMIAGEHSIHTITPYIEKYFPDSTVVPIIVSARFESIAKLHSDAQIFADAFGENVLFLASVDFAHNVSLTEGLNNNNESVANISAFNYSEILKYTDTHMDSPVAITTLLLTMQKLGASSWTTWESTHGALITEEIDADGTSYVVGVFTQPTPAGKNSPYKSAFFQY